MSDETIEQHTFLQVLREATDALESRDLPYVLIGGIASAVLGRPRTTRDIDLFVREEAIKDAVGALEQAGFETREPKLDWLYKAFKHGVQTDVIFKAGGDVYLDDDMERRAVAADFNGQKVRLIPAEDLLVIKALSHDEETPQYWHDALAIIASNELDWDYLLRRARHGGRRILSLLVYAQSSDLVVPDEPIRRLFQTIYGP